ncbi:RES family NAD+ phosphorylase [Stenotrophomonas sp. TWI587]|uniref:RES family NAD+ phosphorylase n=1 Tax=Stenotrophomonas sp. TWI587 TaxID=3136783 RepID=UPI00320A41B2
MEDGLCEGCVEDDFLRDQSIEEGKVVACTECDQQAVGITLKDLGRLLEPLLRQYYVVGDEYRTSTGGGDDEGYMSQSGESLSAIIEERLGCHYKAHDRIIDAVRDAEDWNPWDGDTAYWNEETCYQFRFITYEPSDLPSWHQTRDEIKHGRRFFSPTAKAMFDELFKDIRQIQAWSEGQPKPVCYELPANAKLFRARVVDTEFGQSSVIANPGAEVGPPPSAVARSGRMNAEGVSVLYASTDGDTCVAEMRPANGSTLAVIQLTAQRTLRVLDFCLLESALGGTSLFDPDYAPNHIRLGALRQLHKWVTAPVVPGREADYLITQTMAEYLAHVCEPAFDGVVFRSAQNVAGINVVLFSRDMPFDGDLTQRFGVAYAENSLAFVRIRSVAVTSEVLTVVTHGGKTYLIDADSKREYDDWW